jgi:hypothetical protein
LFLSCREESLVIKRSEGAGGTDVGGIRGELDSADGTQNRDFLLNKHKQRINKDLSKYH